MTEELRELMKAETPDQIKQLLGELEDQLPGLKHIWISICQSADFISDRSMEEILKGDAIADEHLSGLVAQHPEVMPTIKSVAITRSLIASNAI